MLKSIPLMLATLLIASGVGGCASRRHVQRHHADTQAVAKILAANAAGPVAFTDLDAANALTHSVREAEHLKAALILDKEGSVLSRYFAPGFDRQADALLSVISLRVHRGENEFSFQQEGLDVSVVPIRGQDPIIGYVAIGSTTL